MRRPTRPGGRATDDLIRAAAEGMYRVKKAGGDRVCI